MFLHVSVILLTGGGLRRNPPPGPGRPPPTGTRQTPPQIREEPPPGPGRPPPDQADPIPPGRENAPTGKKTAAYGQLAAGTHPTGMHSCYIIISLSTPHPLQFSPKKVTSVFSFELSLLSLVSKS